MGNSFCGMMPRDTYCMKNDNVLEDKRKNIVINYYCEQSISNKINIPKRAGSADLSKKQPLWDNDDIFKIRNLSLGQNPLVYEHNFKKK